MNQPQLSESLEDYLEVVLQLEQEKGTVRGRDIAERLAVRAASVSKAMENLAEQGFIERLRYGAISLTQTGRVYAESIWHKHQQLARFFVSVLGVDNTNASNIACHLEHTVPDSVFARMCAFTDFMVACPRNNVSWNGDNSCEGGARTCEDADCENDRENCPALARLLTAAASTAVIPTTDVQEVPAQVTLADISAETDFTLIAFCDEGELHARSTSAGFVPQTEARLLSVQEGVYTVLGKKGQVMALTKKEAELLIVKPS